MKEYLKNEIDLTFKALLESLSGFNDLQIDVVPFEGSWTAGQCTEHIMKAASGMPAICNGNTEKTLRQADEKVEAIKTLFLDFTKKFQSPDFIRPRDTSHNLAHMTRALENIRSEMQQVVATHDLSLICKDFEVPGFGPFTKYELISFALIHTQRHTQQLKRIYNALTA